MIHGGHDLNASRVRLVSGPPGMPPRSLVLDGIEVELPMVLSLQNRSVRAGAAGAALLRQLPHLACSNFLQQLGTGKQWTGGRHRIDANQALRAVFEHLRPSCKGIDALALALPAYLSRVQIGLLYSLVEKYRWLPLLGSVTTPLAAGLAAHAEQDWSGVAVLIDADNYALTCTILAADEEMLWVLDEKVLASLNIEAWKTCLLDGISERCVHQSRRDPRDCGLAEQMLYEQFDEVFDACRRHEAIEIVVQANQWCQNLIVQPDETAGICGALVEQLGARIQSILSESKAHGPLNMMLVSAAAAQLPELLALVQENIEEQVPIIQLAPEAAAWGAHDLAGRFRRKELARGHLDRAVPLARRTPKLDEKKAISNKR